jgi:hypothetical protein
MTEAIMKEPKISVALTTRAGRDVMVVLRNDNRMFNNIHWNLAELEKEGYDGICLKLGNAVMRMLDVAHHDELERYPALVPPRPACSCPRDMASELIALSVRDRTRKYVEAVDGLFEKHPEDFLHTSLPQDWDEIRKRLMRFPD